MFISSISRWRSGLIGAAGMGMVIVRLLIAEGAESSVLAASRSTERNSATSIPYLTTPPIPRRGYEPDELPDCSTPR